MTVMSYQDILQQARRLPLQSQIQLAEDLIQTDLPQAETEMGKAKLRPLPGFTEKELRTLANSVVASEQQTQLSSLLEMGRNKVLSAQDAATLDTLVEEIDRIALLKARALYTLQLKKQDVI